LETDILIQMHANRLDHVVAYTWIIHPRPKACLFQDHFNKMFKHHVELSRTHTHTHTQKKNSAYSKHVLGFDQLKLLLYMHNIPQLSHLRFKQHM